MPSQASNSLLLQGGQVFDAPNLRFQRQDVRVRDGNIVEVARDIRPTAGERVLDIHGKLLVPGLVDLHLHCYRQGQILSIDAEELAPRAGTTTFVDGGSSGSLNFQAFREHVIEPAGVRILAFLNISAIGQVSVGAAGVKFFENDDDRLLDVASAIEVIEKNRDLIVGVKVRAYTGLTSLAALTRGREVAARTRSPMMVHIASGPPHFEEILPHLRAGDIVTHIYHGGEDSLVDAHGRVREVFREAKARGVTFDVGLDRIHTSFATVRAALAEGFFPHYLSTDLTLSNRHITVDMPTTISKFVALGMPLEQALAASSYSAAVKLGMDKVFGIIRTGNQADLGIFELQEGAFDYHDVYANTLQATKRLAPLQTLYAGKILEAPRRSVKMYEFMAK
ncbi:MAG TPA: amidohydrolase family protein [Candidatus Methylomirabilis sp.]|nr:amidohydrolase family protein [Candidatus Methylomirabilis sp.]